MGRPRTRYFKSVPCSKMPEANVASPTMRGMVSKLTQVCKGGKAVVEFWSDDWETEALPRGQILRSTGASCWITGTRTDWGQVID